MGEAGTRVAGTGQNLSEGKIQQTSTPTDAAIVGDGFYILKDSSGNTYYTRSGQFEFNASGQLDDSVNKYFVQGFDPGGALGNIDVTNYKTLPAQPTTVVNMAGNLLPTDPTDSVSAITVYDAQGNAHVLGLSMANNTAVTPGSWLVTITDSGGNTVGSGEIRFNTDGTLQSGFNTVAMTGTPDCAV